jgi:hypothetical protein
MTHDVYNKIMDNIAKPIDSNHDDFENDISVDERVDYAALLRAAQADLTPEENREAAETGVEMVMLEDAATLLSTLANNEAKAINFIAMSQSDHQTLTHQEIYEAFIGIQGDNGVWSDIGSGVPGAYAKKHTNPLGLLHVLSIAR